MPALPTTGHRAGRALRLVGSPSHQISRGLGYIVVDIQVSGCCLGEGVLLRSVPVASEALPLS